MREGHMYYEATVKQVLSVYLTGRQIANFFSTELCRRAVEGDDKELYQT